MTTCRFRARSKLPARCRACFRRWRSTANTTSTARSTRRCTRRWRWTKACRCCSASIRSFRSTPARRAHRGGFSKRRLNQGGLPLVLGQTFRAIIHSRMKVGMEKYARQYPDAAIMLFEPGPRGRGHVLREHLQLPAAEEAVRARVRADALEPASARRRARADAVAPRHRAAPAIASRIPRAP